MIILFIFVKNGFLTFVRANFDCLHSLQKKQYMVNKKLMHSAENHPTQMLRYFCRSSENAIAREGWYMI